MIVDGNAIASDIERELRERVGDKRLSLAVVFVGDNRASEKFIERKKDFGERIGVSVVIHTFPASISSPDLVHEVASIASKPLFNGVIVQLPLPGHIDAASVLAVIPPEKDVDALSQEPRVSSPVVGAIAEILKRGGVPVQGKNVVVIGRGALVGLPVARWAQEQGAQVTLCGRDTDNLGEVIRTADILITGAGSPRLIKEDMVKDGAVLIDAGTSESSGKLVGDIDPLCASKASLFTPVPGGVGPVTVAMLFSNLLYLFEKKQGGTGAEG